MKLGFGRIVAKHLLEHLPWIIMGILLCWPAFYNGFPLVYSDSGTYINSSFELLPPADRSIGYGYFIRIVTWQASLWPVILAQGLFVSGLIWRILRAIVGSGPQWAFLATMALLTLFSSLPWYVSQLMPDVFAGLMVLGFALLLKPQMTWADGILGTLIILLGAGVHTSHIVIGVIILVFAAAWLFWRMSWRPATSRFLLMALPLIAAVFFIIGNQAVNGHGFRLSRTSNIFLAAHLAEAEMLNGFLEKECPLHHYSLCDWGAKLPSNVEEMLWDPEISPVVRYGGWEQADSAVAPMIDDFFSDWGNVASFFGKGFSDGLRQMGRFGLGDGLTPYGWESAPCVALRWRMPRHVDAYLQSRQTTSQLHMTWSHAIQVPLICLSLLVILVGTVLGWHKLRPHLAFVILLVLGFVSNAMVLAILSCVLDRYQARISWLLPMAACLVLVSLFSKKSDTPTT